ncbi:M24 family metallopeptidase [Paeniglutamicibacter sulfureus]|uniref:Xaa-Pro dipeptidase n=1 Tax=Paeniglutamicibacter sulfureus TaxID=43666 RepID=A0ABU2BGY2_9MICC|nr:Xaa-Pro dipeptidase [Paeniglutamicibacter sulfureus]
MEHVGVAPMLFTTEEYAARLAAARVRMQEQGLSALLVTDPANIYYLTGYNAWSFYTPQLVFVPMEGDMILFSREMDANGAFRTSWLPPENIVGYPERYVHRPHLHPFDWVAYALRARYLIAPAAKGCVGLEMDAHFFSPKGYRSLVNALPEWTLVDCFELVNWVRAVKSPAEIQLMRQAAVFTNLAMQAAHDAIDVGARQCDIAAAISQAQLTGTAEAGGDYPAIVPMLPTGQSADTPHLTWSDEPLKPNEAMIVELAGAYHRYHVPMARTFMPGKPSPQLAHLARATDHALAAVLEAVAPGTPVQELSQVFNRTLFEYGYEKASRIGYSIGVGYPPDWGERTISLRSEELTVLQENMTFHLMCGMWMEGYGYEVSEAIRVTDTGVETFTAFPRGLVPAGDARLTAAESSTLLGNPGERAVSSGPGLAGLPQPLTEPRRPATPRFGFTTPTEEPMTGPIGIVARNAERADRDPVWPVAPEPEAEPEAENGDASPGQTP